MIIPSQNPLVYNNIRQGDLVIPGPAAKREPPVQDTL